MMQPQRPSFASRFDAFSYKRLTDLALMDYTKPSFLGAVLTLVLWVVCGTLLVAETVAYLTPTLTQEVTLSPPSLTPVHIRFNVSFPRIPCQLLSLDVHDALGRHRVNLTRNVLRYRLDGSSGRRLQLSGEPGAQAYEAAEGDINAALGGEAAGGGSTQLTVANFESFIHSTELALVTFGAPWCPWSRRLAPVFEEVAGILSAVDGVKLGRVDCMQPEAQPLCHAQHIAAFPTMALYKGGLTHTHIHYHGDRTVQAILDFLVLARQDVEAVADPHAAPSDGQAAPADGHNHADGSAHDQHELGDRLARQQAALAAFTDVPEGGALFPDAEGVFLGRDPADPGPAMGIIEAMHRAGLTAPGDRLRAAAGTPTPLPPPVPGANASAGEGECAPPEGGGEGGSGARKLAPRPGPEGCNIAGSIAVKRVPGTFSISPSAATLSLNRNLLNTSHVIHELTFGEHVTPYQLSRLPAGTFGELHRLRGASFSSPTANTSHLHYVSVIGSTFTFSTGHVVDTFKYTANSHAFEDERVGDPAKPLEPPAPVFMPDGSVVTPEWKPPVPTVTFSYDLSPMGVAVTEARKPLYRFLTSLCAIIGGVFTVTSLLDSLLHASLHTVRYKLASGKQG